MSQPPGQASSSTPYALTAIYQLIGRDLPEMPSALLGLDRTTTSTSAVLVVGTTMADRSDALYKLRQVMLLGGPAAIAVACLAGWLVAGLALHPMERLRQQAAAITASGLDRRLTVPPATDELRRLAETLKPR